MLRVTDPDHRMLDKADLLSWQQRIRLYCRALLKNFLGQCEDVLEGSELTKEDLLNHTVRMMTLNTSVRTKANTFHNQKSYLFGLTKVINGHAEHQDDYVKNSVKSSFVITMLPEWGRFVQLIILSLSTKSTNTYPPPPSAAHLTILDLDISPTWKNLNRRNLTTTLALLTQSYKTFFSTKQQLRHLIKPKESRTVQTQGDCFRMYGVDSTHIRTEDRVTVHGEQVQWFLGEHRKSGESLDCDALDFEVDDAPYGTNGLWLIDLPQIQFMM
ncbi:hypothetical protein Tco_1369357 [Tanacetum coccineum]